MGVSASGCHHNLSLWYGGDETVKSWGDGTLPGLEETFTYLQGGENTFLPVPEKDKVKPGPVGLQCIGGVIEHLGGINGDRLFNGKFVQKIMG